MEQSLGTSLVCLVQETLPWTRGLGKRSGNCLGLMPRPHPQRWEGSQVSAEMERSNGLHENYDFPERERAGKM